MGLGVAIPIKISSKASELNNYPCHYVYITCYYLFLLPIACCLLPTAYCVLPLACRLLHNAYCLWPVAYFLVRIAEVPETVSLINNYNKQRNRKSEKPPKTKIWLIIYNDFSLYYQSVKVILWSIHNFWYKGLAKSQVRKNNSSL